MYLGLIAVRWQSHFQANKSSNLDDKMVQFFITVHKMFKD